MLGIVLSGGGSKGAYQIGVWKGLRKLHIKYDIVTGTSVGAINAALLTQNKFRLALKFWSNLKFDDVIDEKIKDNSKKEIYKTYAKGVLKGGMTVNNLEETIDRALNIKKVYKSKINMGIITFNVKSLKPLRLIKKGIPRHKLKDYIVASASCFPAFAKKTIDDKNYIDGGFYDNLPINLAIDMGATEIIAVDLKEIGMKRKIKNKKIPIKIIEPKNDIGSFLIFEKEMANRCIRLGYNDIMKEYKKLEGDKYTFKDLSKNYAKIYSKLNNQIKKRKSLKEKINSYDDFIKMIETLGYAFEIDDSYIYKTKKFNKILLDKLKNIEEVDFLDDFKNNKKIKLKKELIKYIYNNLDNKKISKYMSLLSKEYLCALYLKTIK